MKKLSSYPVFKTIKRMLKYVSKENKMLYVYFAFFTLIAFIYPFFAIILPKVLIRELLQGIDTNIINVIYIVSGYFIAAGLFGFLKTILQDYSYPKITYLRINLLRDLFDKVVSMDYKYIEDAKFFEENDRAMSACSGNTNGLELVYHKLFETPASILAILTLIIFIGRLNVFILLGLFLNVFVLIFVRRKIQSYTYKRKADLAHSQRRMNYYYKTTHDFAFGKDIRVYNFKDRIIKNYDEEINGFVRINKMIKNREFFLGFLSLISLLISDALVYGILIYKTAKGFPIEDFTMYLVAITSLSAMLKVLVEDVTAVYNEGQYANDFHMFMDGDLGEKGGDVKAMVNETLEIEFRNVSFKYPKTDIYIFENLNFTIHKGEKLAIVGINGAGKTTLVKLMTGLFDVTDGEILINGINIKKYSKKALFSMFSVVFQDVNILPFTLKENVACTSENIDEDKVLNALAKVGLKEKTLSYKKGLDQMLSKIIDEDGTDLSGGEKQKLSIARALYKNANMVIMDEPTAALDALAEAEIYENFSELIHGKTALYISHRLASTKFCDKIAMFDSKCLIEYGNHEELMNKKGKYYEMFTVQGKYYQKEAIANE
ncbi:ABC transporter ATP-binding protein [Sedimentibacter sp. zth1]|uniref:ABC transporter ATP-binding protein n=1 Tax=Sedimentibacter sp. zth1 TaxID=2816908 RepID=UPI001A931694|nr:ABC transporter ATP-binding protein [Sedimentibacter sp. zth1]QSX04746.1 ABC transporter ATP-binding protein [Sedimentibacter sp. zth1]